MTEDLLKAAHVAAATIDAMYQWIDRVEKAGGTTSISGIAACHAMITSMNQNRDRVQSMVMDPLNSAIKTAGDAVSASTGSR